MHLPAKGIDNKCLQIWSDVLEFKTRWDHTLSKFIQIIFLGHKISTHPLHVHCNQEVLGVGEPQNNQYNEQFIVDNHGEP